MQSRSKMQRGRWMTAAILAAVGMLSPAARGATDDVMRGELDVPKFSINLLDAVAASQPDTAPATRQIRSPALRRSPDAG